VPIHERLPTLENCFILRQSVEYDEKKLLWLGFNVQPVLLSQATGSVSSSNLSDLDVIDSKAREIANGDIVTIENGESCPWQQYNFKSNRA